MMQDEVLQDEMPVASDYHSTYENFTARCPSCSKESIFNRASDLCTFDLIYGKNVVCLNENCGKPFRIVGDTVNNPHEMLIFDCYELIERKHYMNCILNLAQAYEVFFSLYLRVELLYKPYSKDRRKKEFDGNNEALQNKPFSEERKLDKLNRITEVLYYKIKKNAFNCMRALFLHYIIAGKQPSDLSEAETLIGNLPDKPGDPGEVDIKNIDDGKLVPLLMKLKETDINTLRNDIVHKHAYRPTRKEVEAAIKETRSILFPLTTHLKLHDDINWYCLKRKSSTV